MQQHSNTPARYTFPVKMMTALAIVFSVITGLAAVSGHQSPSIEPDEIDQPQKRDSLASVQAFMQVYQVLISPRCMNCHPSGDVPLQGDDSHLHAMLPKRGEDGKGLYAMKCANCHQATNAPGLNTPPGHPNWHLPPANMKMVFQGRTPHQLAKQLMDPAQNGNKNKKQLLEHAKDGLVMAAWNPGEGRTLPPMSYDDFAKAWTTWIKKGAYAPAPNQ